MRPHRISSIATLSLLASVSVSHAQHLVVVASEARDSPTIDGKLDEPMWTEGTWRARFTRPGGGLEAAEAQKRFAIAFGPTHVYFGAECFEPNMPKLVARITERDGRVYTDDCIELMLDPTGGREDYYHIVVNALGAVYDAQVTESGASRSDTWNCSPDVAAARGEGSWTVEMAIPLSDLEWNEAAPADWAFNVARERKAGQEELSAFVPTLGTAGFHQPDLYATLKLPSDTENEDIWDVQKPYSTSVRVGGEGAVLDARVVVANRGSGSEWAQLQPELVSESGVSAGEPVVIRRKPGVAREVDFSVPLLAQGEQALRLRLVRRGDPPTLLREIAAPISVTFTPLTIDITRPYYRDSIYATEQIDEIAFTIALPNAAEDWLADKRVRARLEREAADEQVVARANEAQANGEVRLTLPVTDLAAGDYQLVADLVDADGAAVWSARKRLRKLSPAPNEHEWRIDENHVLLHNGEPFLPFGWFSFEPREKHPDDAYTIIQSYSMELRPVHAVRTILDTWAEKGLYGVFSPFGPEFTNRDREPNGRPPQRRGGGSAARAHPCPDGSPGHPGLVPI